MWVPRVAHDGPGQPRVAQTSGQPTRTNTSCLLRHSWAAGDEVKVMSEFVGTHSPSSILGKEAAQTYSNSDTELHVAITLVLGVLYLSEECKFIEGKSTHHVSHTGTITCVPI